MTDPAVSQLLYQKASSTDKSLKFYPGMWHSLLYGETPENVDTVFADIVTWLDEKSAIGIFMYEKETRKPDEKIPNHCQVNNDT